MVPGGRCEKQLEAPHFWQVLLSRSFDAGGGISIADPGRFYFD
jgi:hypothetical protein